MPNYVRKLKPQKSPRVCLKCQKTFESTGPGNRICMRCNGENGRQSAKRQP